MKDSDIIIEGKMIKKQYFLSSSNENSILRILSWEPEQYEQIKGVIQIAHGITEHIAAYENVAKEFVEQGYIVIGNDHLGHGKTDGPFKMYFGERGSWNYIVDDLFKVRKLVHEIHPNLTHILIGISLGSFAVRHYLINYPHGTNGVILIGTGYSSKLENLIAKLITWIQEMKYGDKTSTKLIDHLALGMYNKYFSNEKSKFSWLFSSKTALNRYLSDPLRGQSITVGLFRELLYGMEFTRNRKNVRKMDKNIPIFVMSGKDDPVGCFGKKVAKYVYMLKNEGFLDIDFQLYKNKRHHLLLDDNNDEIIEDILDWIKYYMRKD